MFFVVFGSIVSLFGRNFPLEISFGIPVACATMFRSAVPPHMGQSVAMAKGAASAADSAKAGSKLPRPTD
jgi:hypothetical protein